MADNKGQTQHFSNKLLSVARLLLRYVSAVGALTGGPANMEGGGVLAAPELVIDDKTERGFVNWFRSLQQVNPLLRPPLKTRPSIRALRLLIT